MRSQKKSIMSINSEIPQHIIQLILSKLPIVNLPASRLVCKAWNNLVLNHASTFKPVPNTFFVCTRTTNSWRYNFTMHYMDLNAKHLDHPMGISYRFDSNWSNIKIVNSCNGLLCILKTVGVGRTCVDILNPITNEYFQVPEDEHSYLFYSYGFGFSPKTKQYKVTRFCYDGENDSCILEIFTLGGRISNKWRRIDSYKSNFFYSSCVYFNGALYWVGKNPRMESVMSRLVVEEEKFEEISLPEVNFSYNDVTVGAFNGELHVVFSMGNFYKFEVWMMRSDEGKDYSWNREFVVDGIPKDWVLRSRGKHLQLIQACEDGEILCLVNGFYLFQYNPKIRRMQKVSQNEGSQKSLWVQIESFNFDSLKKILARDEMVDV